MLIYLYYHNMKDYLIQLINLIYYIKHNNYLILLVFFNHISIILELQSFIILICFILYFHEDHKDIYHDSIL